MENTENNILQSHTNIFSLLNNFVDQAGELIVTASIDETNSQHSDINLDYFSDCEKEQNLFETKDNLSEIEQVETTENKLVDLEGLEHQISENPVEFVEGSIYILPALQEEHIDHKNICKTISEIKLNSNTMSDPSTSNFKQTYQPSIQPNIQPNTKSNLQGDMQNYQIWQGNQNQEFSHQRQNTDAQNGLSYGNTSFENGYLQGLLPGNEYETYSRCDQMGNFNQVLNRDFSSHMLTQQELPPNSSACNKLSSYHQNTTYNTHNNNINTAFYNNISEKSLNKKHTSESGSEEIEDRSQEKKLTTTPIPSDAEKTSSGSSVSSGSHEDSPSPNSNSKLSVESSVSINNVQEVEISENVIEINENTEFTAPVIPVSPSSPINFDQPNTSKVKTWVSDIVKGSDEQTKTDKHLSWSVCKEERRKRRHKKKVIQQSLNKNLFYNHHGNKHQNSEKSCSSNINRTQITEVKQSYSSYSGLIPKTTADPTSINPILPRPITLEKLKSGTSKSKSEKKISNKVKRKTKNHNNEAFQHSSDFIVQHTKPLSTIEKDGSRRWQTVTAIQGPKLPPMLSERDRIPKRGRPSKKMTEFNLKFKPDEVPKKPPTSSKSMMEVPGASRLVAMYTINDKGCIEELGNKPKENRRSKERAEAFRNMLSEISKKTSIQKKTASAKDVVGAFKAVGVRTRKQVSSTSTKTFEKKKKRRKKGMCGDDTPVADLYPKREMIKPQALEEDRIYTFSELAKQYKISNSILYRAMEQSQRSSLNKTRNVRQKTKEEKPLKYTEQEIPPNKQDHSFSYAGIKTHQTEDKENYSSHDNNHNTSVEEFTQESFKSEKIKKKKKKKKHKKKEKNENGKRKRSKDKKKRSKKKERLLTKSNDLGSALGDLNNDSNIFKSQNICESKKSSPENSTLAGSVRNKSLSSVSGCDEAYDGGDSSSDRDFVATKTTSKQVPKIVSSQKTIFGGNAVLPSFQGIKEHGGLIQFSEHTKKLTELNKHKKHKHKKKKLTSKLKSITDPKFVNELNDLIRKMKLLKITNEDSFLSGSFIKQCSNVFAHSKSSFFSPISSDCVNSYRDPFKNNFNRFPSQQNAAVSSKIKNMSFYCKSPFFVNNGFIKPYKVANTSLTTKMISSYKQQTSQIVNNKELFTTQSSFFSNQNKQNNLFFTPNLIAKSTKDSETENQKSLKKKRGWPLGKLRGTRTKKFLFDRNFESDYESDISNLSTETKKSTKTKSNKTSNNSGMSTPSTTDDSTASSFNHELVDHIKAAITAKLDASVSTDVVTKTVDAAVANYLQKVTPVTDDVPVIENIEKDFEPPIKRARGRPPKNIKTNFVKLQTESKDEKTNESHPKKVWVSKHKVTASTCKLNSLKQRKRGPGRPKKLSNQKTPLANLKSQVLCKKASKSYVPSSCCLKKQLTKSNHREQTSLISSARVKKALEALVTTTALDKHIQSTKWLAQANKPEPGMYHGTNVDLHMNEAIESTIKTAALGQDHKNMILKKSLEFVVAKLKSKQNQPNNLLNINDNNNNSIQTTDKKIVSKSSNLQIFNPSERAITFHQKDGNPLSEINPLLYPNKNKVFQSAGFFCEDYKTSNDAHGNDDDKQQILPLPNYPIDILFKSKDFQLPYDIWWSYKNQFIFPNQSFSTQFTNIDKSVYVNTQPNFEKSKIKICECKTLDQCCQTNCVNKKMYIECSPESCPCGPTCKNRVIQNKKSFEGIEIFQKGKKDYGIKSKTLIKKDEFIIEYVGEIVSKQEFLQRSWKCYKYYNNSYGVKLGEIGIVDAHVKGGEARFIQHSCNPNCEMQTWKVLGEDKVCLFAKKEIKSGEELTVDYEDYFCVVQEQKICKCESPNCRKIINRKNQSFEQENLQPPKIKKNSMNGKKYTTICDNNVQFGIEEIIVNHIPTISKHDRSLIKTKRIFLLRNLNQIKYQQDKHNLQTDNDQSFAKEGLTTNKATKMVDETIKEVFTAVMSCKDELGISLAIPFINLPSKLQNPELFKNKDEAVDLSCVECKILNEKYSNIEAFCSDMLSVFRHAEKYHGRKSTLGKDVSRLRRAFTNAKHSMVHLVTEDNSNQRSEKEEIMEIEKRKNGDYIRCICGIYKDEGVMIQCEKCYVWQHCDCMDVEASNYNDLTPYFCEECDEREVPVEVEVIPQPPSAPPGHTYYLTLVKDDLVVKQGDCVRLIHDHRLRQRSSANPPLRASYRIQSHLTPDSHDFFRIIKLWTDDSGDKYAYGYHFLRPHDTKHSDSRLFYNNELVATPYNEIVPLEAIISQICVMDLETYISGRPKGVKESDVYVCEHRVDLSLRLVNKPIKQKYPICTKSHVFNHFSNKLVLTRNTEVPEQYKKNQSKRTQWLRSIDHGEKSDDESVIGGDDSFMDKTSSLTASYVVNRNIQCNADNNIKSTKSNDVKESCSSDVVNEEFPVNNEIDSDGEGKSPRNEKKRRLSGILSKLVKDASTRQKQEDS